MDIQPKGFPVDIHAHVLPILELCRFASMADSAVCGLYALADVAPEFKKQMNNAAPSLAELADSRGGDQVAGALWVALRLLELYVSQPEIERGEQ